MVKNFIEPDLSVPGRQAQKGRNKGWPEYFEATTDIF